MNISICVIIIPNLACQHYLRYLLFFISHCDILNSVMMMYKPNRLRELRKQAGLSQNELANAIHFAQSMISGWECNTKRMNLDQAKLLADFFNVSVGDLAGDDDLIEQPAETIDGLREEVIQLLMGLSDADLRRVEDFVAGLKAGRGADAALQRSVPPEVP